MKKIKKHKHLGDVAFCECLCHIKGTPQPPCSKCYSNKKLINNPPKGYDWEG